MQSFANSMAQQQSNRCSSSLLCCQQLSLRHVLATKNILPGSQIILQRRNSRPDRHAGALRSNNRVEQETGPEAEEEEEQMCEPTVAEYMTTDVISLTPSMSIREAVKIFLDKKISGAPVVDEEGKLVGVLSETDVMWKEAAAPKSHYIIPPIYIGLVDSFVYLRDEGRYAEECQKVLARTVEDAMTQKVVWIYDGTTLEEAADIMLTKKVNRLPVCRGDGIVVGVLTRSDVLKGMVSASCELDW